MKSSKKLLLFLAALTLSQLIFLTLFLFGIIPFEVLAQELPSLGEEEDNLAPGETPAPKADDDSIFGENALNLAVGLALLTVGAFLLYWWISGGGEPPAIGSGPAVAGPPTADQMDQVLRQVIEQSRSEFQGEYDGPLRVRGRLPVLDLTAIDLSEIHRQGAATHPDTFTAESLNILNAAMDQAEALPDGVPSAVRVTLWDQGLVAVKIVQLYIVGRFFN